MAAALARAEERSQVPALLVSRRLEGVRVLVSQDVLGRVVAERLGPAASAGLAADDLPIVTVLTTQWDILLDVAHLQANHSDPIESHLELLTIMALGHADFPLAHELHRAHLERVAGERAMDLVAHARRVEKLIAPRGRVPRSRAAASVGIGLAYLEARALAEIGAYYYARSAVEEDGIRQLHTLSAAGKEDLIEVLVAVAWADGRISPEEERLIGQQIELAGLDKATRKKVKALLAKPPVGDPLAGVEGGSWDPYTRRFVLEQATLLSLVDDEQGEDELDLLQRLAVLLGARPGELDEVLVEVDAFYQRNRVLIRDFGPVSGSMGRLHRLVVERAQNAVRSNMRKIVQEIRETGELAKLLGAASVRQLTPEEGGKVRSQLLDICKTVPALAIFALPGGGLLLPILIKLLPFDIRPTAFAATEPAPDEAAPGAGAAVAEGG